MVAILVSVAAALYFSGSKEQAVAVLAKDEIVILRTPGGMLEVSTLIRNEVFQWSTEYTCLPLDCGKLLERQFLRFVCQFTTRTEFHLQHSGA